MVAQFPCLEWGIGTETAYCQFTTIRCATLLATVPISCYVASQIGVDLTPMKPLLAAVGLIAIVSCILLQIFELRLLPPHRSSKNRRGAARPASMTPHGQDVWPLGLLLCALPGSYLLARGLDLDMATCEPFLVAVGLIAVLSLVLPAIIGRHRRPLAPATRQRRHLAPRTNAPYPTWVIQADRKPALQTEPTPKARSVAEPRGSDHSSVLAMLGLDPSQTPQCTRPN